MEPLPDRRRALTFAMFVRECRVYEDSRRESCYENKC